MQILITGGTGFIGSALLPALLAQGHRLTVLTRNPARAALPAGVRAIADAADCAAEPPQAVINLAGENLGAGRWSDARRQVFIDSRVGTTERLLTASARWPRPPAVWINGSAIGWYGARGDQVLTEDSTPGSGFSAELCARWEAAATPVAARGTRLAVIRIGIVLGLPGGALGQMLPPFRFGLGGPLGHGRQWMSWIHRDDLVAMMQWLLDTPDADGAFNGTAPVPVRNVDFSRTLGRVLRRPAVLPMPAPALRLLVGPMADELLLSGQQVLPQRAMQAGFRHRYPTLEGALRQILAQ